MQIVRYCTAPAKLSSGVLRKRRMGRQAAITSTVSTSAAMSTKPSMVESRRLISPYLPRPKCPPIMAAPPFATATTITSTTFVTCPAVPTALMPAAPVTCPSITMSATLYTACRRLMISIGSANSSSFLPGAPAVRSPLVSTVTAIASGKIILPLQFQVQVQMRHFRFFWQVQKKCGGISAPPIYRGAQDSDVLL